MPASRLSGEYGSLASALLPVIVLLTSLPVAILLLHKPDAALPFGERIQQALHASTVPRAFLLSSALALLTAFILFPSTRRQEAPRAALKGALQLLPPLAILLLAWILGSLFQALGTADVLSRALGNWLPLAALPAGVFIAGCLISFISGTSWGTMGLLMPLALPLTTAMAAAQDVPPEALPGVLSGIVPVVIGAVFGGAVFGDHCSPYSDTTIVSALAAGITTHEHTVTQLPYALLAAGAALAFGYLPVALGLPGWLAVLSGSAILTMLVLFWTRADPVPSRFISWGNPSQ